MQVNRTYKRIRWDKGLGANGGLNYMYDWIVEIFAAGTAESDQLLSGNAIYPCHLYGTGVLCIHWFVFTDQ